MSFTLSVGLSAPSWLALLILIPLVGLAATAIRTRIARGQPPKPLELGAVSEQTSDEEFPHKNNLLVDRRKS